MRMCLFAALLLALSVGGSASAHGPGPAPVVVADVSGPTHLDAEGLGLERLDLVLGLVNHARSEARTCGGERFPAVPKVRRDARLDRAARQHALDMARHDYFSHTGRNGSDPGARITRARYRWSSYGENIAAGYPTPRSVVRGWLASEGHCRTIMGRYRDIGIGYAFDLGSAYGGYWVQDFGTRRR